MLLLFLKFQFEQTRRREREHCFTPRNRNRSNRKWLKEEYVGRGLRQGSGIGRQMEGDRRHGRGGRGRGGEEEIGGNKDNI
mgnify:CR=1 FL=1